MRSVSMKLSLLGEKGARDLHYSQGLSLIYQGLMDAIGGKRMQNGPQCVLAQRYVPLYYLCSVAHKAELRDAQP